MHEVFENFQIHCPEFRRYLLELSFAVDAVSHLFILHDAYEYNNRCHENNFWTDC